MQNIPDQCNQPHTRIQYNERKGFRRKRGDSPFDIQVDIKVKKEKKQNSYSNPDPWARLIGRSNTAPVYMNGHLTMGLLDTGAQLSLISRDFCEQHNIPVQQLDRLIGCDSVNGTEIQYEGYAEVNFQIPNRTFNEDHLFLVVPPIEYHKQVPVIIGTYVLDRLVDHLEALEPEEFNSLDISWKSMHNTRVEAKRLADLHCRDPPLGMIRTTRSIVIPPKTSVIIKGHTKIQHGGYSVNAIVETSPTHPLPKGLEQTRSYSNLTAGSSRVRVSLNNSTTQPISLPPKAIIGELHLANLIPKLLYPSISEDSELNDQNSQAPDLDDQDLGLTEEKVQAHRVLCEDLGEDLEADLDHAHVSNTHVHTQEDDFKLPEDDTFVKQSCSQADVNIDDTGQWVLDKLDLTGLEDWSPELQQQAKDMLTRFAPIFSKHDLDMGRTNLVKHNIILNDPLPFKEKYRRIPPQMYDEVRTHLKEMLDLGAIRPSHSPWASAIVLVRKKDGKLRFCIDLRKLNQRTIKDSYSLPRIEQILDNLVGAQIFSTLDLKAGYWQVEMVEECKPYTAFTCGPLGFFECETMPFGATNAPATFQRLMENCLGELNLNWCIVYLDDIIIYSSDPASHIERLEAVFKKLQAAGLKLKPSKCSFFRKEISYLGHIVSSEGISTDPKKVEAVRNWPTPKTVYDVRSFLGFIGYYRRFIKDFSKIAKPLRILLQGLESQSKKVAKKTSIPWGVEQQETFDQLKELCCTTPILAYPDHKLPFILHTDSSTEGLGAILYQVQGGEKKVIAYASRSVNKAESHYPAHKLEFLALKWAITEKFHDYLYGGNVFDVYTDNNPLTYILTTAKLDACGQRWVARLANYNFNLHYKTGSTNVDADALSRIPWPEVLAKADEVITISAPVINAVLIGVNSEGGLMETLSFSRSSIPPMLRVHSVQVKPPNWRTKQLSYPPIAEIISLIENHKIMTRKCKKTDSPDLKRLLKVRKKLVLKEGVLYRRVRIEENRRKDYLYQVVVPPSMMSTALKGCHDQVGHQGKDRTLSLIRERFFWPRMYKDVESYVGHCKKCLLRKAKPHVAPLQPILVSRPLDLVHMDFLSIEPSKGNIENVLVITDHFTRYALAFPSKTQTAKATAKLLWDNFIVHYGFPASFISDQGRNFESELITELCAIAGVDKVHTTPYHPMTNGMCERFNSTLCNMLGTLDETCKQDWKSYLGAMTHAYNCTAHVSTTYSPYYLMFGRHPRLPIDLELGLTRSNVKDSCSKSRFAEKLQQRLDFAYSKARDCSDKQAKKYKQGYDKKIRGPALQKNDLVLVKIVAWKGRHKIQDRWEPEEYYVVSQPHPGLPVYRVKQINSGKERVLHRNLLLPLGIEYKQDDDSISEVDSEEEEVLDEKVIVPQFKDVSDRDTEDTLNKAMVQPTPDPKPALLDGKQISLEEVKNSVSSQEEPSGTSFSKLPLDSSSTLDSKYLVPIEDDSTKSQITQSIEMSASDNQSSTLPSIKSETSSLMNTREFLDFVDEMSEDDRKNVTDDKSQESSKPSKDEVSITESQFSSVMSYHEGDDTSSLASSVDADTSNIVNKDLKDDSKSTEGDSSDFTQNKTSVDDVNDITDSVSVTEEAIQPKTSMQDSPPKVRRSTRRNLGAPPIRYGDPRVHGNVVQKVATKMYKLYDKLFD